jgi:hypothetical protein
VTLRAYYPPNAIQYVNREWGFAGLALTIALRQIFRSIINILCTSAQVLHALWSKL